MDAWFARRFDIYVVRFFRRRLPVDAREYMFRFLQSRISDGLSRDIRSYGFVLREALQRYGYWSDVHAFRALSMLRHNMHVYACANGLISNLPAARMLARWPPEHRLWFLTRVYHNVFYTDHQLRCNDTMVAWGLRWA